MYTGASKMQLFTIILLGLACCVGMASASNYTDCSTNYSTLERALLHTDNNAYNLWTAFYPPRSAVALFVDVTYEFQDEGGLLNDNDSRHFFWSSATFYFIQPPRVFGFTSMFFAFIPEERKHSLTLILPYDCKGIKTTSKKDKPEENLLEVLTQRLKLYAQRRPASTTVITNNHFVAIAVEDDVLEDIYHRGKIVGVFMSLVFGIPLLLFVLVIVYAKGARWQIRKHLVSDSPSSQATLSALTVIALLLSIYVCILDSAALWFARENNELVNDHDRDNLLLIHDGFLFVTVVLDLALTLLAVCAFIALICVEYFPCLLSQDTFFNCIFCCLFCCASPYSKESDDEKKRYKEQKLWLLMVMFVAPIWCIGSHIGYIIIAWISFPTHASAMFSMYVISFVYYFYTLRQFYLCMIDFHHTRLCCKCTHPPGKPQQMEIELQSPIADKHKYQDVVKDSGIKIWIVALEVPLALFLGLVEVWVSYGFIVLPIVEVISEAPTYLFSLASAVLVFVSGLLAYKLLGVDKSSSNGSPSLTQFVEAYKYLKVQNLDKPQPTPKTGAEIAAAQQTPKTDSENTAAQPTPKTGTKKETPTPKTDAEKAGVLLAAFLYKLSTDNQGNGPKGYDTLLGKVFPPDDTGTPGNGTPRNSTGTDQ